MERLSSFYSSYFYMDDLKRGPLLGRRRRESEAGKPAFRQKFKFHWKKIYFFLQKQLQYNYFYAINKLYFLTGGLPMAEAETKRVRRTPQQRAADLDTQIAELENSIARIEDKKQTAVAEFDRKIDTVRARIAGLRDKQEALLSPKPRKPRRTKKEKIAEILKQAQKSGMKPEEIAEKLGISSESEQ